MDTNARATCPLSAYRPGQRFAPHYDGAFRRSEDDDNDDNADEGAGEG